MIYRVKRQDVLWKTNFNSFGCFWDGRWNYGEFDLFLIVSHKTCDIGYKCVRAQENDSCELESKAKKLKNIYDAFTSLYFYIDNMID